MALPNVRIAPSGFDPGNGHASGLLFRADGFEGISLGLAGEQ
jgi:hypothetical protein